MEYHLLGNVAGIAVSCDAILKVSVRRNGSAVVDPGSAVEARNVAVVLVPVTTLVDAVGEAIAGGGTRGALTDHLEDGRVRARVGDHAVIVAGAGAVVILHETRVADTKVGGVDTNAASRLLKDDRKNEAVIRAGLLRNLLDGVPDGALE